MAVEIEIFDLDLRPHGGDAPRWNKNFLVIEVAGLIKEKTVINRPSGDGQKCDGGHGADTDGPASENTGLDHLFGGFDLLVTDVNFLHIGELAFKIAGLG